MSETMKYTVIALILLANVPIFKRIFNYIFPSIDDFYKSVEYIFTPDLYSLFKGNYVKDWFGELKIGFLLFGCGIIVFVEYKLLMTVINIFM